MRRCPGPWLLLLALLLVLGGCTVQETATVHKDTALAERIERLVDTFLTSDDESKHAAVLSDARATA
jgi:hypothetical protein